MRIEFISIFFVQRSILENFQFSPLKDLEKNNQTGLIRLTDRHQLGHTEFGKRLESFEKAIISYFRSRNEDNLKKPIPAINTNSKTRISSFDVVRPSNTFPEPYGTSWKIFVVNLFIMMMDMEMIMHHHLEKSRSNFHTKDL
jgi:hypothetical protein